MLLRERCQARHEPGARQGRQTADLKNVAVPGIHERTRRQFHAFETDADGLEIGLAVLGQFDRAGQAREKRHPKLALELADELANRTLRDAKLVGGFAEAAVAAGDLESPETGQ